MILPVKKILINNNSSIESALKQLAKTGLRCLVVVDKKKKYLGTITDGDLRKSILSKKDFSLKIDKLYNSNSTFLIKEKFNKNLAIKLIQKKNITLIPIVDDQFKVTNYYNIYQKQANPTLSEKKNLILIMAGGKGKRLQPFTSILPKPLIPVKQKPVLVHIMNLFKNEGYKKFLISINKNHKVLKSYLNLLENVYDLRTIEESHPLGTAGVLKKIKKFSDSFFMINCDSLIKIKPKELLSFHEENKNLLTLVAAVKNVNIPYGVCEFNNKNGKLLNMMEKPNKKILANTGLYVCSSNLINYLPSKNNFDMSELVNILLKKKKKIGVFPIKENEWQDTGNWTDFLKINNKKNL